MAKLALIVAIVLLASSAFADVEVLEVTACTDSNGAWSYSSGEDCATAIDATDETTNYMRGGTAGRYMHYDLGNPSTVTAGTHQVDSVKIAVKHQCYDLSFPSDCGNTTGRYFIYLGASTQYEGIAASGSAWDTTAALSKPGGGSWDISSNLDDLNNLELRIESEALCAGCQYHQIFRAKVLVYYSLSQLPIEHNIWPMGTWDDSIHIRDTSWEGDGTPDSIRVYMGKQYSEVITVAASTDDAGYYYGTTPGYDSTLEQLAFGNWSSGEAKSGMRFLDIDAPQEATILWAYMRGRSGGSNGYDVTARVYGEDTSDATTFGDSTDFEDRNYTTAYVDWTIDTLPGDTVYTHNYEWFGANGDFSPIAQEIVDRADWTAGNDMVYFLTNNGTTDQNQYSFRSYDLTTSLCPVLHIGWLPQPDSLIQSITSGLDGTDSIRITGLTAGLRYRILSVIYDAGDSAYSDTITVIARTPDIGVRHTTEEISVRHWQARGGYMLRHED